MDAQNSQALVAIGVASHTRPCGPRLNLLTLGGFGSGQSLPVVPPVVPPAPGTLGVPGVPTPPGRVFVSAAADCGQTIEH